MSKHRKSAENGCVGSRLNCCTSRRPGADDRALDTGQELSGQEGGQCRGISVIGRDCRGERNSGRDCGPAILMEVESPNGDCICWRELQPLKKGVEVVGGGVSD